MSDDAEEEAQEVITERAGDEHPPPASRVRVYAGLLLNSLRGLVLLLPGIFGSASLAAAHLQVASLQNVSGCAST